MRAFSLLVCCVLAVAFFSGCSSENSTTVLVQPSEEGVVSVEDSLPKVPFVGGPIMITEVDPANIGYEDHEGGDAGWIEFFNTSSEPVNLSGFSLTDNLNEPTKWQFGEAVVPPQGFMLVYLSGKDLKDYTSPSDSINLIGPGCWTWTDAQAEPTPGYSYANPLEGQKKNCFNEADGRFVGATMKLGENEELGWASISVFVGTGNSSSDDVVDMSLTNEILLKAFITKDRNVSLRLAQPDVDDWRGFEMVFTGTGDSNTVYRARLPQGKTTPDLKNIYGTRLSPADGESLEVVFKAFSYVARNRGHEPHASFKIKNRAGSLYLLNAEGIVDSVRYPEVPVGKSWSYEAQSGFGFAEPSPYGFTEGSVVAWRSPALDTLTELPPSGYYVEPFMVALPEDAFVRCEIGGKAPDANSPLETALVIAENMTLRCASFIPGTMPGQVLERTYIFDVAPSLPTVFISGDPGSFFDPDTGIYMEGPNAQSKEPHLGANYWEDKEIPIHVDFLEPGVNQPAFAKDAGLKIFGNYSRQNFKKSVSVTFREKYGDKRLEYPLFPEHPELTKFKSFILRNNGGNFWNDYIRDMLGTSITEGLGVDYQRGRASVVYYNGEYFGIHNIRERSTEYYFETHYGVDPDDIDLLKAGNEASAGSSVDYLKMMNWLADNHLDDENNYGYIASQIDVDNFMNYMQTEMFINNRDWPGNNLKKWRVASAKTPWKWFLYDTDFGFGSGMGDNQENIFKFSMDEEAKGWPNGAEYSLLLRRLMENSGFRTAFINRFCALLSMNFEPSRVLARIDVLMSAIESEIPKDQKRWKHSASHMRSHLAKIKEFAMNRPAVIFQEMGEFYGLGEMTDVNLSVTGLGKIYVHGLPLDRQVEQLHLYKGLPLLVEAVPEAGAVWAGWGDGIMENPRIVLPENQPVLQANFK
ncbi:MAG: CotH kinase family protein [Fibrobacter sp.]|nr:CotH kinase family protein [Fibrobacter sp.]